MVCAFRIFRRSKCQAAIQTTANRFAEHHHSIYPTERQQTRTGKVPCERKPGSLRLETPSSRCIVEVPSYFSSMYGGTE